MVEPVLRFRASLIKVLVKIMDRIETIQKTAYLRSHSITCHSFGPPQVPQNEAGTGVVAQAAKSKSGRTTASQIVFDRAHLAQYTMDSPELEREIVGLHCPASRDSGAPAERQNAGRLAHCNAHVERLCPCHWGLQDWGFGQETGAYRRPGTEQRKN
jgi:hypothetical protein